MVTIEENKTLEENQLTYVRGILRLASDSIKQVMMNDGFLIAELNRCTITDNTGTVP